MLPPLWLPVLGLVVYSAPVAAVAAAGAPSCRCHADDSPADCAGLCALWTATGSRTDLGPWAAGASVCSWGVQHGNEYTGASCTNGRVTSLVLENLVPPLTGELPEAIGNLTALSRVSLWQNNMEGELPLSLGKLASLKSLNLNNNKFIGTLPPQLGQLGALSALALADNAFDGSIPSELGHLRNLTELFLDGNRLRGPIPPEIGALSQLTYFQAFDNRLEGAIPASLGSLSALTTLDLSNNSLAGKLLSTRDHYCGPRTRGQLTGCFRIERQKESN